MNPSLRWGDPQRPQSGRRSPLAILAALFLAAIGTPPAPAQNGSPKAAATEAGERLAPPRRQTYEAELIQKVGNSERYYKLSRFRRLFRLEHFHQWSDRAPFLVELYDGASASPIWSYDPKRGHAGPSLQSSFEALSEERDRLGEAEVRRLYKIPVSEKIYQRSQEKRPGVSLEPTGRLLEERFVPVGLETIAGVPCEIRESRFLHPAKSGGADAPPELTDTWRVWVDPKSGLILQQELTRQPAPSSPMPPFHTLLTAKSFRLSDSLPPDRFRLPAGTRASIPRIFAKVPLPPGVIGIPMKGPGSEVGIIFKGSPK